MWKVSILGACGLLLGACADDKQTATPEVSTDPEGQTTGDLPSDDMDVGDPQSESSDGEESDGDGDDTGGFIPPLPDAGPPASQCDVWTQDCPDGEKCNAYIEGSGAAWNSTRCVDITDSPNTPGSACTGSPNADGDDDCDIGSMCWGVDAEGEGYCVSLCGGSQSSPLCEDPSTSCVIVNEGVLNLCLPDCNPLLQDCPADGESCYPSPEGFSCAPDVSGGAGAGMPCSGLNTCVGGTFCVDAAALPECDGPSCCTEWCDVEEEGVCMNGTTCELANPEGAAPPGTETIGGCVLPG